jgi:uncharacterized tellurite resistance protein B-like protein
MTIEPAVLEATKRTAKALDLPVSRFIEIILKANIQMTGPVQSLMRGLFGDLLEADKSLSDKEKDEIREVISDDVFGVDQAPEQTVFEATKKAVKRGRPKKTE